MRLRRERSCSVEMPGQHALQLDEPPRTGGEVTDDEKRPLVADEVERAGVGRPLVVGVALWRGDGGDGGPPLGVQAGIARHGQNRPLGGVTVAPRIAARHGFTTPPDG